MLQGGGRVVQETRGWNEALSKTVPMRGKEEAHDYRYFPDPDLPPLVIGQVEIDELAAALPELPEAKRSRWQTELGLTAYDAGVLSSHPEIAHFFEHVASLLAERWGAKKAKDAGKKAGNFIQAEILRYVSTNGLEATFPVVAESVADLLDLVEDGTINGKIAKAVFGSMVETGRCAKTIIEAEGLAQVTDTGAIEEAVRKVLEASPAQVAQYKGGKTGVVG